MACGHVFRVALLFVVLDASGVMAAPCSGASGVVHINDRGSKNQQNGGFVADGAFVSPSAFVGPNAQVCDSATVEGRARVYGNAIIRGEATVSDDAWVFGDAAVEGNAVVRGEARVSGKAIVGGDAVIEGNAIVRGHARLRSGVVKSGVTSPPEPEEEVAARAAAQARAQEEEEIKRRKAALRDAEEERERRKKRFTEELVDLMNTGFDFERHKQAERPSPYTLTSQSVSARSDAPCRMTLDVSHKESEWFTSASGKHMMKGEVVKTGKVEIDFGRDIKSTSATAEDVYFGFNSRLVQRTTTTSAVGLATDSSDSTSDHLFVDARRASRTAIERAGPLLSELVSVCAPASR